MRLFIAIELDDSIKQVLIAVQSHLEKVLIKGNKTSRDNFHITLRFIGEVDEEEVKRLKNLIKETARQTQPFNLYLDGTGYFSKKDKKIIWIGVNGQLDKLMKLKGTLEDELETADFSREERDYTPHITLVRQAVLKKKFDEVKKDLTFSEKELSVNSVALMESKRIDGELVYKTLYRSEL